MNDIVRFFPYLALISAFLYAVSYFFDDEFIKNKNKVEGQSQVVFYTFLSSIFSLVVIIPIFIFKGGDLLTIGFKNIVALYLSGLCTIGAVAIYLEVIRDEDVEKATAWWQMIPPVSFLLAWIFLGETVHLKLLLALAIIFVGVVILNGIENGFSFKFKKKTLILMPLSLLLAAFIEVFFKYGATAESFFVGLFWNRVGVISFSLILMLIGKIKLQDLKKFIHRMTHRDMLLNFSSESLVLLADVLMIFAVLYGQVAFVDTLYSTQIIWVYLIARFFVKSNNKKDLKRNIVEWFCILMIIFGIILSTL